MQLKTSVELLAQWFGLGRIPYGPGTFGTLGAIPLVYFLNWALVGADPIGYLVATLLFMVFAMWVAQKYETLNKLHDPSHVVIDEVAGFLVAMTWVPFDLKNVAIAFVLFRFFDIVKPFPINRLDKRVGGGFGTVIDDIVAGLIVNVLMQFWLGRF